MSVISLQETAQASCMCVHMCMYKRGLFLNAILHEEEDVLIVNKCIYVFTVQANLPPPNHPANCRIRHDMNNKK